METIRIAYFAHSKDYADRQQHFHSCVLNGIDERNNLKISLDFMDSSSKLEDVLTNDYRLIIIHLGYIRNAYDLADEIAKKSKSFCIAESSNFPKNQEEILQHFDDYHLHGILLRSDLFEILLKNTGIIPNK